LTDDAEFVEETPRDAGDDDDDAVLGDDDDVLSLREEEEEDKILLHSSQGPESFVRMNKNLQAFDLYLVLLEVVLRNQDDKDGNVLLG
jgi:hypothetical protein